MKKRFLSLGLAFVMLFALAGLSGCRWERNYRWSENSFSFEVVADREYARVGDNVTVTATFRNLSGRNLLVTVPAWEQFDDDPTNLDQLILFGFHTLIWRAPRSLRIPCNAVITVVRNFTMKDCYCEYLYGNWHNYPDYFTKCNLCAYGYYVFEIPVGVRFYMGRLRNRDRNNTNWSQLLDRVSFGTNVIVNVTYPL